MGITMDVEKEVARHYTHADLTGSVLAALRGAGHDLDRLTTADLAPVDEFHLGWHPQTVGLATRLAFPPGTRLLDIGAGIGGPARHFAEAHGCSVTGIDLTPAFVAAATELSARTGLADKTRFVEGSALSLPFADASFDAATLIHVGMNIADKPRLFAEARRVLVPGGTFALYEVMRVGEGALPFPQPWADTEATSFVETPATYHDLLAAAGFRVTLEEDRTPFVRELAHNMREKAAAEGPPRLGLQVIIGPTASDRMANLFQSLEKSILAPVEMVATAT